ncbi:UDP-N-acetylmuramate dehydrogenase [endosymbiont of Pachyrhynchus infernalis]|uniref:UDP-N-acetylmuramate dehydrogenase n=1 Tax=endosymbiont of Pachyrhynchus infernalis TaxID=1971488 RepID=UPI000DC736F7|nr:UDP-N-acetylmuramate dehydrogenase [endosymbiont of Pachyrhynchus infernalis]BBA84883.1 UDP-N-acetylenolpyruvoylglucosamine reductase [endosymbiont of Pachyrhynchus infernalis]
MLTNIEFNKSLKKYISFSMNVYTKYFIKINKLDILYKIFDHFKSLPIIILGNGTNTIFLKDFLGLIIINNIKYISFIKKNKYYYLHVGSGINWNDLVLYSIKNNIYGLENLAMIPGKVGAAPIFNIGAYGLEIKNICKYVDILDIKRRKIIRFNKNKCKFKYRNSKLGNLSSRYIIIYLGLKLPIKWKPLINYYKLKNINIKKCNPRYIYNFISNLRKKNIPNYKKINNSGSFFKNLTLNKSKIIKILNKYSNVPYSLISKYKFRIPTGWLIDKCDFKGFRIGNVCVDSNNSAIITNYGSINNDIIFLIKFIYYKIYIKFNIKISLEVLIYFYNNRINLNDIS